MTDKKPNLDLAYALESVQDNRNLYAAWAKDYETDFASTMDTFYQIKSQKYL